MPRLYGEAFQESQVLSGAGAVGVQKKKFVGRPRTIQPSSCGGHGGSGSPDKVRENESLLVKRVFHLCGALKSYPTKSRLQS